MKWFDSLPDPKDIGTSEYRAIYELLRDALDFEGYAAAFPNDTSEEDALELAEGILAEFIGHAQGLQQSLIKYRSEKGRVPDAIDRP